MTEKALASFDLNNASEVLRDKLKLAFVELIPEGQWQALIDKEWETFISTRSVSDGYNRTKDTPSRLSELCQEAIEEIAKEKIKAALNEEWALKGGGHYISAKIKEAIAERQDELIKAMLTSMFGDAISGMLSSVQDRLNNPNSY